MPKTRGAGGARRAGPRGGDGAARGGSLGVARQRAAGGGGRRGGSAGGGGRATLASPRDAFEDDTTRETCDGLVSPAAASSNASLAPSSSSGNAGLLSAWPASERAAAALAALEAFDDALGASEEEGADHFARLAAELADAAALLVRVWAAAAEEAEPSEAEPKAPPRFSAAAP